VHSALGTLVLGSDVLLALECLACDGPSNRHASSLQRMRLYKGDSCYFPAFSVHDAHCSIIVAIATYIRRV